MVTGIAVPLEAAIGLSLAGLAVGIVAGRIRQRSARGAQTDPLLGLFSEATLADNIEHANRVSAARRSVNHPEAHAVLRGRIDQMAMLHTSWDRKTREEMLGQIAAVMQAGIRRDDHFTTQDGEGFTIIMPGADEAGAKGVAARLRHALTQLRLPQFGGQSPLTASFGVAAGKPDDQSARLVARALAALEVAQRSGSDHVVAASDIEDVIFLPPPAPDAQAA